MRNGQKNAKKRESNIVVEDKGKYFQNSGFRIPKLNFKRQPSKRIRTKIPSKRPAKIQIEGKGLSGTRYTQSMDPQKFRREPSQNQLTSRKTSTMTQDSSRDASFEFLFEKLKKMKIQKNDRFSGRERYSLSVLSEIENDELINLDQKDIELLKSVSNFKGKNEYYLSKSESNFEKLKDMLTNITKEREICLTTDRSNHQNIRTDQPIEMKSSRRQRYLMKKRTQK